MVFGIALAFAGGTLYAAGVVLQATEARAVSREHALKLGLLKRLAARKRWLAGTAVGLLGWVCEAGALLVAPLTVVQPALSFGLIVLLLLGEWMLEEPFGFQEVGGVLLVIAGVTGIALVAPERSVQHASLVAVVSVLGLLAVLSLLPRALGRARSTPPALVTVCAGLAFAWAALISKFVADAIDTGSLAILPPLLAVAVVASLLAMTNEMSALQTQRASAVTPVVFVLEMLVPVLLAPLLVNEAWSRPGLVLLFVACVLAGAILLANSPAVSDLVEAQAD